MADNNPNIPGGAVPPGAKVQPKKETVRINLPPKPSAAPTIKLPTLPPGGPTGAPSPAASPAPAPTAPALRTAAAPAAAPAKGAAPTTAQQRPAAMQRPAATSAAPAIKTLDKVLIFSAAVISLGAVGFNFYIFYFVLKPMVENFQP